MLPIRNSYKYNSNLIFRLHTLCKEGDKFESCRRKFTFIVVAKKIIRCNRKFSTESIISDSRFNYCLTAIDGKAAAPKPRAISCLELSRLLTSITGIERNS